MVENVAFCTNRLYNSPIFAVPNNIEHKLNPANKKSTSVRASERREDAGTEENNTRTLAT